MSSGNSSDGSIEMEENGHSADAESDSLAINAWICKEVPAAHLGTGRSRPYIEYSFIAVTSVRLELNNGNKLYSSIISVVPPSLPLQGSSLTVSSMEKGFMEGRGARGCAKLTRPCRISRTRRRQFTEFPPEFLNTIEKKYCTNDAR